jgi:hypothetical protein
MDGSRQEKSETVRSRRHMSLILILKRLTCEHNSFLHSEGNIICQLCGMPHLYKKLAFDYMGDNHFKVYKDWCNSGLNKELVPNWKQLFVRKGLKNVG